MLVKSMDLYSLIKTMKKRTILVKEVDGEAVVPLTQFIELLEEKNQIEDELNELKSLAKTSIQESSNHE
jgi:hypothetical protein